MYEVYQTTFCLEVFILTLVCLTSAHDGCSSHFNWRCGDICMSSSDEKINPCYCGNQTFDYNISDTYLGYKLFLCTGTNCQVTEKNEDGQIQGVNCSSGTPHSLFIPHEGKCNYHQHDILWHRNHFPCLTNGLCIPVRAMCQGKSFCSDGSDAEICKKPNNLPYLQICDTTNEITPVKDLCQGKSLCSDKSDLRSCRNPSWTNVTCIGIDSGTKTGSAVSIFTRCKGAIPGQCIVSTLRNNGRFDCLDRSDEDVVNSLTDSRVDWENIIKPCKTGFYCMNTALLDNCVTNLLWCHSSVSYNCQNNGTVFSTDEESLCRNVTFWRNKTCDFNGIPGKRCNGYWPGQCIPTVPIPGISKSLECKDKSDQIIDPIPWNSLQPCDFQLSQIENLTATLPGISCVHDRLPGNCLHMKGWCTPGVIINCKNDGIWFRTNDDIICKNFTFWRQKSCNFVNQSRCEESWPGQCIYSNEQCAIKSEQNWNAFFNCSDNFSDKILPRELVCDGHPQCQNGNDENLQVCENEYRKKGIIKKNAIFACQSNIYPKMEILAVPCDGNIECLDGIDEKDCQGNDITIGILGTVGLTVISLAWGLYLHKPIKRWIRRANLQRNPVILTHYHRFDIERPINTSIMKQLFLFDDIMKKKKNKLYHLEHKKEEFSNQISTFLNGLGNLSRNKVKLIDTFYYRLEMNVHRGDLRHVHLCMKTHLSWDICDRVFENVSPGALRKIQSKSLKNIIDAVSRNPVLRTCIFYMSILKMNFLHYLDYLKDWYILSKLIILSGGLYTIWTKPTIFQSQLVIFTFAVICLPNFINAIFISLTNPMIPYGFVKNDSLLTSSKMIKVVLCFFLILFNPLIPSCLIYFERKKNEDIKRAEELQLIDKSYNRDTMKEIIAELKSDKKVFKECLTNCKGTELSLEIVIETASNLSLLALNYTKTATHFGLQAMFGLGETNVFGIIRADILLAFSVIWSFRTIVLTSIKVSSIKKDGFFGVSAKLGYGLSSFISSGTHVALLFMYFAPFLGQMNLLAHWNWEKVPFSKTLIYGKDEDSLALGESLDHEFTYDSENGTAFSIRWDELERGNGTLDRPHYTLYTGIGLGTAYIGLVLLTIVHLATLYAIKLHSSVAFQLANIPHRMLHCIQSLFIPTLYQDWDAMPLDLDGHRKLWNKAKKEMGLTLLVHWVVYNGLIFPIIYTGTKIRGRHDLLLKVTGVHPEETDAFHLVSLLMWILLCIPTVSVLLQMLLFWLYNLYLHPWKLLLSDQRSHPTPGTSKHEGLSDRILYSTAKQRIIL